MKAANPYLNFPGNTEEAFNFYKSVFGGEFLDVNRFRDIGDNAMGVRAKELDKIAHISFPIGQGTLLMGTDVLEGWKPVTVGTNFYICIEADSDAEAERVFNALCAGGRTEMALQQTEWAEQYGTCADRFGIQWMIMYTGNVQLAGGAERENDR